MENIVVDISRNEIGNDDWHDVRDAKKRKQIQDRLAQRARRKRLREVKKTASTHIATAQITSSYAGLPCDSVSSADYSLDLIPYTEDTLTTALPPGSTLSFPPSLNYERPAPLTVFTALYLNGRMLGLTCGTPTAAKSPPASSDVPLPLQPTPTQQLIVHFNGFDRFPFPKMRDNVINMSALMDEEEFSRDLFTIPSFEITPGAAPWDPRAWKIEKAFADKWGFLFY